MFRIFILSGALAVNFSPAFARHGSHDGCEHGCGYGYRHHGEGNFHHHKGVRHRSGQHRETDESIRRATPRAFQSGQ